MSTLTKWHISNWQWDNKKFSLDFIQNIMLHIAQTNIIQLKCFLCLQEFLKIATSHPFMNDAAFYIINFIIGCVLTLIIFCQVLYFDMFSFTCLFNPIILTLLFIAAMISFTFFVSIFFEKGNLFVPLFFDFFYLI